METLFSFLSRREEVTAGNRQTFMMRKHSCCRVWKEETTAESVNSTPKRKKLPKRRKPSPETETPSNWKAL